MQKPNNETVSAERQFFNDWLEKNVTIDHDGLTRSMVVYDVFAAACDDAGMRRIGTMDFSKSMASAGITPRRSGGLKCYPVSLRSVSAPSADVERTPKMSSVLSPNMRMSNDNPHATPTLLANSAVRISEQLNELPCVVRKLKAAGARIAELEALLLKVTQDASDAVGMGLTLADMHAEEIGKLEAENRRCMRGVNELR